MNDYLEFKDWLEKKEHLSPNWIVVARSQKSDRESLFTYSALVVDREGCLERVLEKPDWEINCLGGVTGFGHPTFETSDSDGIVYLPAGIQDIDDLKLQPFVLYRSFHGYVPERFEFVQSFLLYHEAFYSDKEKEYQRITKEGEIAVVAKLDYESEKNQVLSVDAHHLRDFLAANKSFLVRYHDHTRFSEQEITNLPDDQLVSELSDDSRCIRISRGKGGVCPGYSIYSKLLGKDVIRPYPEPDSRHRERITGEGDTQFEEFIVGRNDDGDLECATCDKDKLSNFFTDRGTPHYLTPVYFRAEVLSKYYSDSKRYNVGECYLSCLTKWGLEFERQKKNIVQVYLGDLGGIPFEEQKHWRSFNVPYMGPISEKRFRRDFLNEVDESEDPVSIFKKEYELVQRHFLDNYGEPLFLPLEEGDKYRWETLHLPLTEDWSEFDSQSLTLAKITTDALNVSLLKRETGKKIDPEGEIRNSIDLLQEFLKQKAAGTDTMDHVSEAFRMVWSIRNTGPAHLKKKNFLKALERYGLSELTNYERIRKMTLEIAHALDSILCVLT